MPSRARPRGWQSRRRCEPRTSGGWRGGRYPCSWRLKSFLGKRSRPQCRRHAGNIHFSRVHPLFAAAFFFFGAYSVPVGWATPARAGLPDTTGTGPGQAASATVAFRYRSLLGQRLARILEASVSLSTRHRRARRAGKRSWGGMDPIVLIIMSHPWQCACSAGSREAVYPHHLLSHPCPHHPPEGH